MILTVRPTDSLRGSIRLPPSKSYSIRAFFIAACGGRSHIVEPSACDDARVACAVARQLGARITHPSKNTWMVSARKRSARPSTINVRESGTVLRFLLPLAVLQKRALIIRGEGTLRARPNAHLIRTLRTMGAHIKGRGTKETVPIQVKSATLQAGRIAIDGSLSSQFISALLIACPQLSEKTDISITGTRAVSQAYVTMTRQVLKRAGITVHKKGPRLLCIPGNQTFKGLKRFTVPSDYGLAAFLLAAASLTKSKVVLHGHLANTLVQADGAILQFLRRMGVAFKKTNSGIAITGPFRLRGGSFCLKDCPDLVPIMSILALFATGTTRLYGIKHVRAKESDRISDLRHELLKINAQVHEKADELTIVPRARYKCNVALDPHNDHRLAMAFSVLGLRTGARIKNIECVSKSYPNFVRDFRHIGAHAVRCRA